MKLKCLHGFFIFEETQVGQVSDFMSMSGLLLSPFGTGYTFDDLLPAPTYSLKGKPFLGFTAIETFEGHPWEVFEANGVIYDFTQGVVVPMLTVLNKTTVDAAGNRYIAPGLLLPGSLVNDGARVKNYSAYWSRDTLRWLYSEVEYV